MPKTDEVNQSLLTEYIIQDSHVALEVYIGLLEIAKERGHASLGDYYDIMGVDTRWVHTRYGWSFVNLTKAYLQPDIGGWTIKFTELEEL